MNTTVSEKGKNMQSINDSQFENEVLNSKGLVLVDFWAEWCGPCRQLGPILEEVGKAMGDKVKIVKMNVDEAPDTAADSASAASRPCFCSRTANRSTPKSV